MKILYLIHTLEVPCHQHIFNFLRTKGIQIDVKMLGPAPQNKPWMDVWSEIKSKKYHTKINAERYDFIISNTHSSYLRALFNNVKPKYGYIDIEHDLFSGRPERFPESVIFTCHKKHTDWCKNNNRKFVECKWPKLNAEYIPTEFTLDPLSEIIFIGSYRYKNEIKQSYGFEKMWYKKYQIVDGTPKGVTPLPDEFTGPLGTINCAKVSKFILTGKSSCFVEALMLGVIPILLKGFINKSEKIDEVLNKVIITDQPDMSFIYAVTVDNLQNKIQLLKSEYLYKEVLEKMQNEWLPSNYFSLPSAGEAIYNYIKEYI